MSYKLLPVIFTIVGGTPIFVPTGTTLESSLGGFGLHHQFSPTALLTSSILQKHGNLERLASYSKNLLTSHILKAGALSFPIGQYGSLGFGTSGIQHLSQFSYPLSGFKEFEIPEKITAGALIKGIPKVSKLPIKIDYSPKTLGISSGLQGGFIGGSSGISSSPFLSGVSFGY